jgi:putative nucleotidyltransferase with HDIG domain
MKLGRISRRKARAGGFSRPVHDLNPEERRDRRVFLCALGLSFAVLVASMTRNPRPAFDEYTEDLETEVIAQRTWKSEFAFESVDLDKTADAAEEAAQKIPDMFYVDAVGVESQLDELRQRTSALRELAPQIEDQIKKALLSSNSSVPDDQVVSAALVQFAEKLVQTDPRFSGVKNVPALALWLQPDSTSIPTRIFKEKPIQRGAANASKPPAPMPVESLTEPASKPFMFLHDLRLEDLAVDGLEKTLALGVYIPESAPTHAAPGEDRTVIVDRPPPYKSGETRWGDIPRATTALENLREAVYEAARILEQREAPRDTYDWTALRSAAYELASLGIVNTVVFDRVATEDTREKARRKVQEEPVMRTVERGRVIQRDGEYWTEQSRADAKTYLTNVRSGQLPATSVIGSFFSHAILVGLSIYTLVKSRPVIMGRSGHGYRPITLVLLVLCSTVLIGRIVSYFEPTGYVVPIPAAAILIAILVNGRAALMTGYLAAGLVSIVFDYSWGVVLTAGAMTFAGAISIYKVRRRSDMTRAALHATFAGLATIVAINLGTDAPFNEAALQRMGLILLNGLATAFVVPGLLSPLERFFGITTDIQLLEYSDLNNEVLSKLAIEIPATYAHSLMLGQLAEAAADAIGANGLLARVCAYYHDIGKMKRPDYFSENQTGTNIHDGLPPRLSSRAIAAHVIEGAEMAREYHLPQPIIDGIFEHHGTNLIGYFYQQALQQNKHGDVREEDFRYPGPKPRSRETAILMICDAVESGVRSIKNPNEERVREFVDKIVASRAEDRQFDDCDLTLKDLDTVSEIISRRMWTAMHSRVAYPDRQPEKRAANVVPMSGGKEP